MRGEKSLGLNPSSCSLKNGCPKVSTFSLLGPVNMLRYMPEGSLQMQSS